MKKIVQSIAHLSLRAKLIVSVSMGFVLIVACYIFFSKAEPEYAVKFGELYAVSGNKAKLIGDYSEEYELATLTDGEEVIVKKINWGGKKTIFVINGVEHIMGLNGKMVVENNLIVLMDNSKKKKKIDRYGKRIHWQ